MRTMRPDALPESPGPDWIAHLDGRTRLARSLAERHAAMVSDLGDAPTYAQAAMIARALWLEARLERSEMDARAQLEPGQYVQHVHALKSILSALYGPSMHRIPRTVGGADALHDYLRRSALHHPSSEAPNSPTEARDNKPSRVAGVDR